MGKQQTTDTNSRPDSPYVGLTPYSDRDAAFFFGRETETEIISANLRSARLTVLYGTSGVGKSSVLQAGVVHKLRELAKEDLKTYGQAEFAVVVYRNWASDPIKGIADAVRVAVADSLQIDPDMLEPVPETGDLVKILQQWSERYGLELLLILDQFEELFNFLKDKNPFAEAFAAQLPEVIKTPDLPVRLLIALRDDTLSLLDYFKESIPGLFDNRLEINRLTASNAREAITEPIGAYNELHNPEKPFEIEKELVAEVIDKTRYTPPKVGGDLEQIKVEQGESDAVQEPDNENADENYVETPNLQLVMQRLWKEETRSGSNSLRMETLTSLGGVETIIQTHLDEVMNRLTSEEKRTASECFKYLVTPMKTKIALTPEALQEFTKCSERSIEAVMKALSPQQKMSATEKANEDVRVLRGVEIAVPKGKPLPGYEVSHDAFIPAILSWRTRYEIDHNVFNQLIKKALPVLIVLLLVLLIFGWRWIANRQAYWALEKNTNTNEARFEEEKVNISQTSKENAVKETIDTYNNLIPLLARLSSTSQKEKDSAYTELKKMIEEEKIPQPVKDSIDQMSKSIEKQKALDLRKEEQVKKEKSIKPMVYLHITDESQREAAQSYEGLLSKTNKFLVDKNIKYVGNVKLSSPQIRYFRQIDMQQANELANVLRNNGIMNLRVQYMPGYEDSNTMRPKHLELWFTSEAIPIIQ